MDPYYLTYKAQSIGYHPQLILSGRRINDEMPNYVVDQIIKRLLSQKVNIYKAKILILGFSFKEDCPDVRNTKVYDVVDKLSLLNVGFDICDPIVDERKVFENMA